MLSQSPRNIYRREKKLRNSRVPNAYRDESLRHKDETVLAPIYRTSGKYTQKIRATLSNVADRRCIEKGPFNIDTYMY